MFIRHEICFAILFFVIGNVSVFMCPKNEICSCNSNEQENFEIFCQVNNSFINIEINSGTFIKVICINSKWSDFYLPNLTEYAIKEIYVYMCDLPNNSRLKTITDMLGASNVEKLIFHSHKTLVSFKRMYLKGFSDLYYLDLSNNNLFYTDQDLLADLPKLKTLKLNKNKLRNITLHFNYVRQLTELNIENNILQSIKPNTFNNLKNLTTLSLKKNNLTNLPSKIFDKLIKLRKLYLSSNNLVSLPENIFAKLNNLDTLTLSGNSFYLLPRYLLRSNTNLQTINLSFNKKPIHTLPTGFFSNLTKLKTLKLKKNGFISLPQDLLWGCFSLTTLVLSENDLYDLDEVMFRDLGNLIKLKIDSNNFGKLPYNISWYLKNLQILDASRNHITFLNNESFIYFQKIEEINMAQNLLTYIPHSAFFFSHMLKIVNFSNNYLTLRTMSNFFIDDFGISSPFVFCTSLKELYLANNHIFNIFEDWNSLLPSLRKLDLKHNYITNLTIKNLQFVSENIEVDLTYNKIQNIFLNNAEEFFKYEESHHAVILIDNNPLHCGCELYDFLRYLEGKMDSNITTQLSIIPGNLTCKVSNIAYPVTKLQSELYTCIAKEPIFTSICPKECECTKKYKQNIFIMNCNNKNFTSMPNITRKSLNFQKIELYFYHNELTQMPNLTKIGFGPVSKLILSHNNISEITLDGLSKTIETLKMDNNNISIISLDVLNFLKNATNLTLLTLHGNPWICDCSTIDFFDFIHVKHNVIIDLQNVICYDKNKFISNMTVIDFCPDYVNNKENQSNKRYTIIFISVGFIIGIFGLLYYIYHSQVKEKLFAHWSILKEDDLDEERS